MFHRWIASGLILTILTTVSPVFAGDLTSIQTPSPVAARTSIFHRSGSLAAFSFQQPAQAQALPAPATYQKHWTRRGKILTIVGVGVAGLGAFMMTRKDQDLGTSFEGGQLVTRTLRMKVAGGLTIGVGALLAGIGLTRKD